MTDLPEDGSLEAHPLHYPPGRGDANVEAGVGEAGDETASGTQHAGRLPQGSFGVWDVHEGHVAHHHIEPSVSEPIEAGGVGYVVNDAQGLPLFA